MFPRLLPYFILPCVVRLILALVLLILGLGLFYLLVVLLEQFIAEVELVIDRVLSRKVSVVLVPELLDDPLGIAVFEVGICLLLSSLVLVPVCSIGQNGITFLYLPEHLS